MKRLVFIAIFTVIITAPSFCQAKGPTGTERSAVIDTVKKFYEGFNDGRFLNAELYTTVDWNHINPHGRRTVGRDATLVDVRAVHQTFLKGVTDTPEDYDVKFAAANVAIVVVPSRLSTFTMPDGIRRENARNIRTFLVVKQKGRWLIQHDHNTFIAQ